MSGRMHNVGKSPQIREESRQTHTKQHTHSLQPHPACAHVCVYVCDASLSGFAVIEAGWTSGLKVAATLQAVMYKTHTHIESHAPMGRNRVVLLFFVLLHYILDLDVAFFPWILLHSFTMLELSIPL